MSPSRRQFLASFLAASALLLSGCPAKKECPSGQTSCFGNCVDAQTDAAACGPGCVICPTGGSCVAGTCECPSGLTACGGACVDTQTSAAHCGACNQPCGLGTCASGSCSCNGGATPCIGWPHCVDITSDAANCSGCGLVCPLTNDVCVSSTCQCPAALPTICVNTCVNEQTDPKNCGACPKVCATGATCNTGTCTCPAGENVCGATPGVCVNQSTDKSNCGSCGNVCASSAACTAGSCVCPVATPTSCGSTTKTCCAGTGCCGSGCQTQHSNGLGQFFYDCNPLDTFTLASATAAADAWNTGTSFPDLLGCSGCYGRQTATSCAAWCWGGLFPGKVHLNSIGGNGCICPSTLDVNWH